MSKYIDEDGRPLEHEPNQMGIVLPCEPQNFGNFVSSLLGKPQTIEKFFKLPYKFDKNDVSNTFHLVEQRINQQNEATLIQFTVRIIYDDDSSVLLNSLDDFLRYKEVRPLASVGVILSWTYLMKFKNKNVPEKQEIDLAFRSDIDRNNRIFEDGIDITRIRRYLPSSSITLRVCHTDRTWGTDIESLITGHIKTLKIEENCIKHFIRKKHAWIGFLVFFFMLLASIFTTYKLNNKVPKIYLEKLSKITESASDKSILLDEKIDLLAEIFIQGNWTQKVINPTQFLVLSLCISVFFGIFVTAKADSKQHSFILLSKAAEEHREKLNKKAKRDWYLFFISLGCSIATGIVANILFYVLFLKYL